MKFTKLRMKFTKLRKYEVHKNRKQGKKPRQTPAFIITVKNL